MMAHQHPVPSMETRSFARALVIAGLGVTTVGVLAFEVTFARTPGKVVASSVRPSVVSTGASDSFVSTGAAGPVGMHIDRSGRFVSRPYVVGAQHSTIALDMARGEQLLNIAGARLYGLRRGTTDLLSVEARACSCRACVRRAYNRSTRAAPQRPFSRATTRAPSHLSSQRSRRSRSHSQLPEEVPDDR
jgi:hypothetical protein